jgi:hypothetical protein
MTYWYRTGLVALMLPVKLWNSAIFALPGGFPFEKYYSWRGESSWILAEEEFAEPGSSTISVDIECHRFINNSSMTMRSMI